MRWCTASHKRHILHFQDATSPPSSKPLDGCLASAAVWSPAPSMTDYTPCNTQSQEAVCTPAAVQLSALALLLTNTLLQQTPTFIRLCAPHPLPSTRTTGFFACSRSRPSLRGTSRSRARLGGGPGGGWGVSSGGRVNSSEQRFKWT